MSLKILALFFGSSLMIFAISFWWNSRKVFFFVLKCFSIFLNDWFLNCLSRCFKGMFFTVGNAFFNIKILVKRVKYLFKKYVVISSCCLYLFKDYHGEWYLFVVLLLLEKRGLTVIQNFLVPSIFLEFKLLKNCFFAWFKAFAHLFLCCL